MSRHSGGWFKVQRSLTSPESDIGSNGYRLAILVTLFGWANLGESTIQWNGKPRKIGRGQVVIGLRKLGDHLKFTKDCVRRQLDYLRLRDTIQHETATEGTLITLLNFEKYQENPNVLAQDCDTDATRINRESAMTRDGTRPPNEEYKNKRNIYTPEFETIWIKYPEGEKAKAFKAFKKYITANRLEDFGKAVDNYLKDCKANSRYLKHLSSFIGSDRTTHPWEEWISKELLVAAASKNVTHVERIWEAMTKFGHGNHLAGDEYKRHKDKVADFLGSEALRAVVACGGWSKIFQFGNEFQTKSVLREAFQTARVA